MSDIHFKDIFDRVEPGPRKEHKRQILRSGLSCFNELGIQATTIDHIREKSGSSTGTIYHHFGNKDGLVAALFFAALDDQTELANGQMQGVQDTKTAIEVTVRTYLLWVTEQPELARFMSVAHSSVASGPFANELVERNRYRFGELSKWLEKGLVNGEVRALPKEVYPSLLIGQSDNYCRAWLAGRVQKQPLELADIFVSAAYRTIFSHTEK